MSTRENIRLIARAPCTSRICVTYLVGLEACVASSSFLYLFACWVIFHDLCRLLTFIKIIFFKRSFQEHYKGESLQDNS